MLNILVLQYLLPALVHISNQPKLCRGEGPIVSLGEGGGGGGGYDDR